ncbi:hypothetical protein HZS_1 [Henneguya salminicola]|nr:hypothetical protein HZS_1 [Henneguya salminicola]
MAIKNATINLPMVESEKKSLHSKWTEYLLNNQEICHSSTSDLISIQKDMPIDIIPHVRNNRPDIMLYTDHISKRDSRNWKKKRDTNTPLAKALEILYNATVEIIPVVICNLGGFSNALTHLKKIIPAALAQTILKNMNTLVTGEAVYIHQHFIASVGKIKAYPQIEEHYANLA